MKKVLIAGGNGFIGRKICRFLLEKGYEVAVLSRSRKPDIEGIRTFCWDVEKGLIEHGALDRTFALINLAGSNVGSKRWSPSRKRAIADSRLHSTQLLVQHIKNTANRPAVYIAASATGYYGACTSAQIFTEQNKPGKDFLAGVCARWEQASEPLQELNIRRVILRTAVVLSKEAGFLKKIRLLAKAGFSPVPGSGKQWLPWIHIEDIASMYVFALEHSQVSGIYNACVDAAHQPDYFRFNKILARQLNRPSFSPHIPASVLKLMLGEMAEIVLNGSRISGKKIQEAGYSMQVMHISEVLSYQE